MQGEHLCRSPEPRGLRSQIQGGYSHAGSALTELLFADVMMRTLLLGLDVINSALGERTKFNGLCILQIVDSKSGKVSSYFQHDLGREDDEIALSYLPTNYGSVIFLTSTRTRVVYNF